MMGMLYGKHETPKVSVSALTGAAILLAGMLPFFRLEHLVDANWAHYCVWLHCGLAVFIFAAIYYLLPKMILQKAHCSVLKQIDQISYEVYLVHHPLIMGPLALLIITPYAGLNITIILITTVALAYIFKYICELPLRMKNGFSAAK